MPEKRELRLPFLLVLVNLFLKMLIIFGGVPVSAPGETVFGKEAVTEVVFVDLVGEALAAVSVDLTAGRGDIVAPVVVSAKDNIGVVVGVHIDGEAVSMFGEVGRAVHYPIVETGSIVVRHGSRIVAVILVNQTDTFKAVIVSIQFIENFYHVLRDGFVADQFADLFLTIKVNIFQSHIFQVFVGDGAAVFGIGDAGNSFFDCFGQ